MDTIIFLCHETDEAIEMKLRKHLSTYNYFEFHSNLTPIPGEDILNFKSVLNIAHIVIIILSVDFMYDNFLAQLRKRAIIKYKQNEIELVQILARHMLMEEVIISGVKTIPESPLATHKDPDAAYIFVVQIIIDKIDIARLKKRIKDLEDILKSKD